MEPKAHLGPERLKSVELLLQIVRLGKGQVLGLLLETSLLELLLDLVQAFPWQNHLQLKVHAVFEELLDNAQISAEAKSQLVFGSNLCVRLAEMAESASVAHTSERLVRNGHMGFVVRLANLVLKRAEQDSLQADSQLRNREWVEFVQGELEASNCNNKHSLGGHTRTSVKDEDSEADNVYDVSMEKIMARFNTYSQIMSSNNQSSNDEDSIAEDNITEDQFQHLERQSEEPAASIPKLQPEFVDLTYWRPPIDEDLAALLTEYE